MPAAFVDAGLHDQWPHLMWTMPPLFGDDNFVGTRIDGYKAARCLLTRPAAAALAHVQEDLALQGFRASSRPSIATSRRQRAGDVQHFVRWARDIRDVKHKADFYPSIDKRDLFRLGYANRSGHSRGSTGNS